MRDTAIVQEVIDLAGGIKALADGCGVSYQAVQDWRAKGRIPWRHVVPLEKRYGIKRSRLRPDVYPPDEAAA